MSFQKQFTVSGNIGTLLVIAAILLIVSAFFTAYSGTKLAEWASWQTPRDINMLRSIQTTFLAGAFACLLSGLLLGAAGYLYMKTRQGNGSTRIYPP
jgi:ABC-type sulfate transport system permease component